MTQNWQHKKEFIFVLKSASPYVVGDPNCAQQYFDFSEPEGWIPTYLNRVTRSPGEIDYFRLLYNRTWWREFSSQPARLRSLEWNPAVFGAEQVFFKVSLTPKYFSEYCHPRLPTTIQEHLGLGLVLTTEAPNNQFGHSDRELGASLGWQALVIPASTALSDSYSGYPWNKREPAPDANHWLGQHREKEVLQITPPLTKYNFTSTNDNTWFQDSQLFPDWWKDEDAWRTFIETNFHEKTYYDFTFKMWMPFEDSDINQGEVNYSQSVRDVWTKIDPSYNFYVKSYEEISSLEDIPETLLPNLYVFASEFDNRFEDADNSRFKQLINLTDNNGQDMISGIFTDIKSNGRKVGEKDEGQYFEKWAQVMGDPNTDLVNFSWAK